MFSDSLIAANRLVTDFSGALAFKASWVDIFPGTEQASKKSRSYRKKVFWPNLGVGSSLQVLDILEYACGLKLGPALILNQNPFFEMASNLLFIRLSIKIGSNKNCLIDGLYGLY